ncbi:MAG: hypothetical protein IAC61_01905 [Firmicutes bacterium]|uniref:Uncharacterized protein n=1 Tax=Candidatus Alloenteromonas pullistercoris TaxID=2840785 RepID=A0A9D9DFS8_9FIRM|nr:hypothetical protein [Candidatus Enteromonas pullistercoris]
MKKKILLVPALAALLALSGCGDTSSSETSSSDSTPSTSSGSSSSSESEITESSSEESSSEESSSEESSEESSESSSTPVEDNFALGFLTPSGVVPTSTLDLNKDTAPSSTVVLSVTNNGEDAFDEEIDVVIGGVSDAITVTPTAADYTYEVKTSTGLGEATVTFSMKNHEEVAPVVLTVNVTENFYSTTITRGNNVEEEGTMSFLGGAGQQHTAVAKNPGTVWAYSTTATVQGYTDSSRSFGIGSFKDAGDNALWTGIRNNDKQDDDRLDIYIRNFYNGWGAPVFDAYPFPAYQGLAFEKTESTFTIDFTLIRKGDSYYYDIGGYHGKFLDSIGYAEATYPGFYSQETDMTLTDSTITYDEEEVDALIASEFGSDAGIDAGCFVNPNLNPLVVGQTREYPASIGPEYSLDGIKLVVDGEYAEHTTVSGLSVTVLNGAPEGTMTLNLVNNKTNDVLDTIQIQVLTESPDAENEQLKVSGGVILNDDGSITFPESFMGTNGVGNEYAYDETSEYAAILKQKVVGGDFSIEFDVSNYKTNVEFPKLMVSLGGSNNQYYIAYKSEQYGGTARIETFTRSVESNEPQWNNSVDFASFDQAASHHYKIESKGGVVNFYVDDMETPLAMQMDGATRHCAIAPEYHYQELPVRISTNGVSATVSNITVTTPSLEEASESIHYGDAITDNGDGSYEFEFIDGGWREHARIDQPLARP